MSQLSQLSHVASFKKCDTGTHTCITRAIYSRRLSDIVAPRFAASRTASKNIYKKSAFLLTKRFLFHIFVV